MFSVPALQVATSPREAVREESCNDEPELMSDYRDLANCDRLEFRLTKIFGPSYREAAHEPVNCLYGAKSKYDEESAQRDAENDKRRRTRNVEEQTCLCRSLSRINMTFGESHREAVDRSVKRVQYVGDAEN